MKKILIYLLFIVLPVHSQTCKVINTEQNLLNISEDELFYFNLNDYFVGDGLIFSLKKEFEYFQADQMYGPGKFEKTIKSLTSFNYRQDYKSSVSPKSFYVLLEKIENGEIYHYIYILKPQANPFKFSVQKTTNKRISKNCYNINQFKQYILATCYNIETKKIELDLYNPESFKASQLLSQLYGLIRIIDIKTQVYGDFIAVHLITEEDSMSMSGELILCKVDFNGILNKKEIILKISGVYKYQLVENKLFFIRNGYNGFEYYDFEEKQIFQISQHKEIDDQFFGISLIAYKNINTIYQISLWNENRIIIFIWNYEQPVNIYQLKEYQTTQITIENNFNTDVYIDNKYLIISNLNGISIYPSIYNNQNNGLQLYYYNVQSQFSSYDTINQILVSIQPEGVYTYFIQDYQLQLSNLKITLNVQKFHLYAKTNQFNKPSVDCPELILYFQVIKNKFSQQKHKMGNKFFFNKFEDYQIKIQIRQNENNQYIGNLNINDYFYGPQLKIDKMSLIDQNQNIIQPQWIKQREISIQKTDYHFRQYFSTDQWVCLDQLNTKITNCYFQLTLDLNFNLILQICSEIQDNKITCKTIFQDQNFNYIIDTSILNLFENTIYLNIVFAQDSNKVYFQFIKIQKKQLQYSLIYNVISELKLRKQDENIIFKIQQNYFVAFIYSTQTLRKIIINLDSDLKDVKFESNMKAPIELRVTKIQFELSQYILMIVENEDQDSINIYTVKDDQLELVGQLKNKKVTQESNKKWLQIEIKDIFILDDGIYIEEKYNSKKSLYFYPMLEIKKLFFFQFQAQNLFEFLENIPRRRIPQYIQETSQYIANNPYIYFSQLKKKNLQIYLYQNSNSQLNNNFFKLGSFDLSKYQNILVDFYSIKTKEIFICQNFNKKYSQIEIFEANWDGKQIFQFSFNNLDIDLNQLYVVDLVLRSQANEDSKYQRQNSKFQVKFELVNENIEEQENNFELEENLSEKIVKS